MDDSLRRLLDSMAAAGGAHDAAEPVHDRRLRNLEPETAQLLALLVRSSARTNVLEIGTSNGYSTIWLAWALGPAGGRLTSIELDASRQEEADGHLGEAGLRESVELICGDATEVVARLSGPFDAVFFDADRVSAPAQLAMLLPKLTDDALLMADNVLSHPEEIAGYLRAVEALPEFDHVMVPIGKGLSVAHRAGPTPTGPRR